MKKLALIFFVLLSVKSFAVKEVSLSRNPLEYTENYGNYIFNVVNFIDARLNKTKVVGYTRVGMGNKKDSLVLPANFANNCSMFFSGMAAKGKIKTSFIAVINQLTVQETHNAGWEYSNVILAIDYYTLDTTIGVEKPFYSSLVRTTANSSFDITNKHGVTLTQAFIVSFDNLEQYLSGSTLPIVNTTIEKLNITTVLDNYNKIIVQDSTIKDGVYYSCKQLANNNPNTTCSSFLASIDTSKPEIVLNAKDPFLKNNSIYAFVKNHRLYISTNYYKFYTSGIDGQFGYLKNVSRTQTSVGATVGAAVFGGLFGIAGGLVGSAIKAAGTKTIKLDRLYIDLETGLLDIEP